MLLVTSILKSQKIKQFFIEFDKESDIFSSWSIKYTSFWEGGLYMGSNSHLHFLRFSSIGIACISKDRSLV